MLLTLHNAVHFWLSNDEWLALSNLLELLMLFIQVTDIISDTLMALVVNLFAKNTLKVPTQHLGLGHTWKNMG